MGQKGATAVFVSVLRAWDRAGGSSVEMIFQVRLHAVTLHERIKERNKQWDNGGRGYQCGLVAANHTGPLNSGRTGNGDDTAI
jgi:hypothetical protein